MVIDLTGTIRDTCTEEEAIESFKKMYKPDPETTAAIERDLKWSYEHLDEIAALPMEDEDNVREEVEEYKKTLDYYESDEYTSKLNKTLENNKEMAWLFNGDNMKK